MSRHASHQTHTNSRQAYKALLATLSPRQAEIVSTVAGLGACTDRAVCEALGARDMNYVRPRITELLQAKALEEAGTQLCPVTQRYVRAVALPGRRKAA